LAICFMPLAPTCALHTRSSSAGWNQSALGDFHRSTG
jgi:hypothetical protein